MDKAGKNYWNLVWAKQINKKAIDPTEKKLNNYINYRFHEFFLNLFSDLNCKNINLLEVGCANSFWLPYFAKNYGFKVTGIDYSKIGCQKSKELLRMANVQGNIICENFFNPPNYMIEAFDIVVSFGVVEHFEDTAACVKALEKFVKPGGMLLTIIPNLSGSVGIVQKLLNKNVYEKHVLVNKEILIKAHQSDTLKVMKCDFFISINFGICNLEGLKRNKNYYIKKFILGLLNRFSMLIWWIEIILTQFPPTKTFSPYIYCISTKNSKGSYKQ